MFNVQCSMIRKLEDISSSSNKLSLYCSMINVTWSSVFNVIPPFEFHGTCLCCISYKTSKLQKKVFMIYVALATKLQNYKKKSIHNICYSCMFRRCINGGGTCTPLWFLKTSTNWHSLEPVSCGCNHPHALKNIPPTIESKNAKPIVVVY